MILWDNIAHHRKFLVAGSLIGGVGAAARALALWTAAIGYARAQLTDGFIDDAFVESFALDSEAKVVGKALSSSKVRLFHRVKGGYLVHDFDIHNGDASKLRRQRDLARDRQRRARAKRAVFHRPSPVENLLKTDGVTRDTDDVTRDMRDSHACTDTDTETTYVRTPNGGRTIPAPPVLRTDHENSGCATTHAPGKKLHASPSLSKQPAADGNYAVIERLAHAVIDETGLSEPTGELIELVKRACATRRIDYGRDPAVKRDVVRRAVESACQQRLLIPVAPPRGLSSVATMAAELRAAPNAAALNAQLRRLRKPPQ